MEGLQGLEKLLKTITWAKGNEHDFNNIYELMQNEYPLLDVDKDILFKEARVYLAEKKNHPKNHELHLALYNEFIINFASLISDKIIRIKHRRNNTVE